MCFKIDWASLIVGRKFPFLLCFTLYLRAISYCKPCGGLYLEGRFNGVFFVLRVWGLIFGGAYTYAWRGLVMELYRTFTKNSAAAGFRLIISLSL